MLFETLTLVLAGAFFFIMYISYSSGARAFWFRNKKPAIIIFRRMGKPKITKGILYKPGLMFIKGHGYFLVPPQTVIDGIGVAVEKTGHITKPEFGALTTHLGKSFPGYKEAKEADDEKKKKIKEKKQKRGPKFGKIIGAKMRELGKGVSE